MFEGVLDFIGCGALNWDLFFEVEAFEEVKFEGIKPKPGREILLERKTFLNFLNYLEKKAQFLFECGGGSSANTIYALSLWDFKCAFIGALGKDSFGEKILKELERVKIDQSYILQKGETSLALILLDKKRDRFIAISPGKAEESLLEYEFKNLKIEGLFHFSSLASPYGQKFQLNLLNQINTSISLDPGEIYAELGLEFLKPFFKKTSYLFLTEYELQKISISLEELFSFGVKKVFLKKGKKGAEVITSERQKYFLPSIEVVKVVDNTGAGDYFNAGVLAGIKLKLPLEKALRLGIISGGISLRGFGRSGILNLEEFKNQVNLLKCE
ncbi:MAG: carbohydrate kinase family protein [Thermodesulfobacteriaceae bacterium]|nr:carbohydrate kinase family protein [Thermodesulfobacteriaceae bacterium]